MFDELKNNPRVKGSLYLLGLSALGLFGWAIMHKLFVLFLGFLWGPIGGEGVVFLGILMVFPIVFILIPLIIEVLERLE